MLGYIILKTGWLSFKAREERGRRDTGRGGRRITRKGREGNEQVYWKESRGEGHGGVARGETGKKEGMQKEN